MKAELESIFNESVSLLKNDLSFERIKSIGSISILSFHDRLQSYTYSSDFDRKCRLVWGALSEHVDASFETDAVSFFTRYMADVVAEEIEPAQIKDFDKLIDAKVAFEISSILSWHQTVDRRYSVSALLISDLNVDESIDGWSKVTCGRCESALYAKRIGVADDDISLFIAESLWLSQEFCRMPTYGDLVAQLSALRLTLSLAVKERLLFHNVVIRSLEWGRCPLLPYTFLRRHGHFEEQRSDQATLKANMASLVFKYSKSSLKRPRKLNLESYNKWKTVTADTKCRMALHHLLNGLSDVLKSSNYGGYNEAFVLSDGIAKIFIGMDGLVPTGLSGNGNRKDFEVFWHPILTRCRSKLSKASVNKIYDMRCALLHGDYAEFINLLSLVYRRIRPKTGFEVVTIEQFGLNFASFIFESILVIESDLALLRK